MRTERPYILFARALSKEETTRCLEGCVTQKRGYSLELRCEGVQNSGIEWRALSDIIGV